MREARLEEAARAVLDEIPYGRISIAARVALENLRTAVDLCPCGHSLERSPQPVEMAPHYNRPDGKWCAICLRCCAPAPTPKEQP